jgi:hypothetical protein
LDLGDARRQIRPWVKDHNEQRPHSSLGYLTPIEFAAVDAERLIGSIRKSVWTTSSSLMPDI